MKSLIRILTATAIAVLVTLAHLALLAPGAEAQECLYVRSSDPYVYVQVCPPFLSSAAIHRTLAAA